MTEELTLYQLGGERGAIERHQGTTLAQAVLVQGLGYELLARSVFPGDQDGNIRLGDLLAQLDDLSHRLAIADDFLESEALVEPLLKLAIHPDKLLVLERPLYTNPQTLDIQRLDEIIHRAALESLDRRLDGRMAGEDHHRYKWIDLLGLANDLHPIDVIHDQVRKHKIILPPGEHGDSLRAAGGDIAAEAHHLENVARPLGMVSIIVND